MRKYNFTLQKDNIALFIKRMEKIMSITGVAKSRSEYTGARQIDGFLKSIGINDYDINPVVECHSTYFIAGKVEFRNEPEQGVIYIHINSDSVWDIPYGTKMLFTPHSIAFNDTNKWGTHCHKNPQGYKVKISSFADVMKARSTDAYEEANAEQYWKDVEYDYYGDSLSAFSERIGAEWSHDTD